jgi:VWFA-related protein
MLLLPGGRAVGQMQNHDQAPAAAKPSLTTDSDPVPSPDADTAPAAAGAQTDAGQAAGAGEVTKENGRYTLRTNAYEVLLNVSVVDGSGTPVDSLPESAFQVYEDGVLQTVAAFKHEDAPVSLGILIDSSGSMYDKRQAVDAASLDLVKLSNPQDQAFLVDFSSEPYLDQEFTSDIGKLQSALSYIKSSGGTALYDAVIASADYLSKNAKWPKQVLLIITDGEDNASSATVEQAIQRVQDLDGPEIYSVGLLFGGDVDHAEAKHAREVLTNLSEQTGGEAYFPHALKDVDGIAHEVADDIRTQYTIGYHSTNPPQNGGYRQVHVVVKEKGYHGLEARTRTGYFPKVAPAPAQ